MLKAKSRGAGLLSAHTGREVFSSSLYSVFSQSISPWGDSDPQRSTYLAEIVVFESPETLGQ
jgi:hypothetical protein